MTISLGDDTRLGAFLGLLFGDAETRDPVSSTKEPMTSSALHLVTALSFATLFTVTWPARADTAISADRSTTYYAVHGSTSGGMLLGALVVNFLYLDHGPKYDFEWFPFDRDVRNNFSASASALSDTTLAFAATGPVVVHLGLGVDRSFSNASMAYLEAVTGQNLLNALTKHLVARPRPYTHRREPRITEFTAREGTENYVSFYSGHTGLVFSSAVAGSYLFGLRAGEPWQRRAVWGGELAFASATATLRVVAGRHYVSDVLLGSVLGTAFGFGIPWLHGYRDVPDGFGTDLLWGGAGLSAGVLFAAAVKPLGLAGNDVKLPYSSSTELSIMTVDGNPALLLGGTF
jgi:membrane-associated phospholipid phosphatase